MARSRRTSAGALAVVALVIAGVVASAAGRAVSSPSLPPISPAELIASVLDTAQKNPPVSGEIAVHLGLGLSGLPGLSDSVPGVPSDPISALLHDHRLRVWRSRDGLRVVDVLPIAERSLIVGRRDAWAWDSEAFTAYHLGPYPDTGGVPPDPPPLERFGDPIQLATMALHAIDRTTSVSVGQGVRVAGRDAYALIAEPRDPGTLVGRIEMDIDVARRIPLRVAIAPRGSSDGAVSAGFTSVSFDPIDAAVYEFTPPDGAKVVSPKTFRKHAEAKAGIRGLEPDIPGAIEPKEQRQRLTGAGHLLGEGGAAPFGAASPVRVFGKDWTSVVAVRTPPPDVLFAGATTSTIDIRSLLPFSGPLFSIRLVDRGDHAWVVVGAVPQATLAAVEPRLP